MSARDEIMAAAQAHGWTVEYHGSVDLQFVKGDHRVKVEFARGHGGVTYGAAWSRRTDAGQVVHHRFEHKNKKQQVLKALELRP